MPEIVIFAAVARNGTIGAENHMPWRLPSDLKRFKAMTIGKPSIMGRKTFVSFGRPLPERPNLVVTRDAGYAPEGAEAFTSLESALQRAANLAHEMRVREVIIMGGGEIYRQALDMTDRLEITEVDSAPEGDTTFPEIDPDVWEEVSRVPGERGEKDSTDFTFVTYKRRK